ncbi:MAG: hypothetical protein H0X47_01790 [Nitrospirales bacterium]|nr:hypothetical protein [Nitrospirales bacterium]
MTCRSARLFSNPAPLDLVYCRMCGSTDVELSCTSKAFGPHLCLSCVRSLIELGREKQFGPVPRRDLVRS